MAVKRSPPSARENICAIPSANAGAPPVRLKSVSSPTLLARLDMSAAVIGKFHEEIIAVAAVGEPPTTPAGLLMAKYAPGLSVQAATMAMMATNDSAAIPAYPTMRMCDSRAISLGVVPLEINEWKPLM